MHRFILATKQDIIDEMIEQSYINSCKVKEDILNYRTKIYIRVSIVDYIFKSKEVLDRIHSILRPKVPIRLTYEVKLKLFL